MTTRAEAMVRAALSQLGVTEDPPGSNMQPYAPAVGDANGHAWCCSFVHWCAQQAGIAFPATAYVPALEQWARDNGCTVPPDQIRTGDVICLDFTAPFGDGSDHVEIATGPPDGDTVPAVGGNTSDRSGGSVDNGGGVYANVRPLAWVATAIRLPGSDEVIEPDPQPDNEEEEPMLTSWMTPDGSVWLLDNASGHSASINEALAGAGVTDGDVMMTTLRTLIERGVCRDLGTVDWLCNWVLRTKRTWTGWEAP